jgi:hypothetical protein
MIIASCLISLLLSLFILFTTLMIWLAHTLEGYPVFLISHANRDAVQLPRPGFKPHGSAVLDAPVTSRSTRARPELWTASTAIPGTCRPAKRNKTAAI